jgi:hypothetical protein
MQYISTLPLARRRGAEWDNDLYIEAAILGHVEIMDWVLASGSMEQTRSKRNPDRSIRNPPL